MNTETERCSPYKKSIITPRGNCPRNIEMLSRGFSLFENHTELNNDCRFEVRPEERNVVGIYPVIGSGNPVFTTIEVGKDSICREIVYTDKRKNGYIKLEIEDIEIRVHSIPFHA